MNLLSPLIVDPKLVYSSPLTRRSATSFLILHHAAEEKCSVREVHNQHRYEGWLGIGYSFYIGKDGTIYKGRGWEYIGAHTPPNNNISYNNCSIGICFEGNYERAAAMPINQLRSGILMVAESLYRYPSISTVCGHKSFNATSCPGKNFPMKALFEGGFAIRSADALGHSLENIIRSYLSDVNLTHAVCSYKEPADNLQRGFMGDGVCWTQWHLNQYGARLVMDGEFGILTESAIRSFQRYNGLSVDGIVGSLTRAKLKSGLLCPYPEPTRKIQRGHKGIGVSWAQWQLNRHGSGLQTDGDFGALTDISLRSFQKNKGLLVDGIIGIQTKEKLKEEKPVNILYSFYS